MNRFVDALPTLQQRLREQRLDGWLLYDFRRSNGLACKAVGMPTSTTLTRRWLVWLPAVGEPVKVVHDIEAHVLDFLPFTTLRYSGRLAYEDALSRLLQGARNVAMEYSPHNGNPYLAKVDAGTVEAVRCRGVAVHSSGDLLQQLTAVLTPQQIDSHRHACEAAVDAMERAFGMVAERLAVGQHIDEEGVVDFLCDYFAGRGLFYDHAPQCAVNAHSANPHYVHRRGQSAPIRRGDWVLIDLWCRQAHEGAVWADITQVAVADYAATAQQSAVFQAVADARDAAHQLVCERFRQGIPLTGAAVDDAARQAIAAAGYADRFTHRTGHNLGEELHGDGCHLDNFETSEERHLLPGTCCTIEPGIYLPGSFGVRLEHDLLVGYDGVAAATTPLQRTIRTLLPHPCAT